MEPEVKNESTKPRMTHARTDQHFFILAGGPTQWAGPVPGRAKCSTNGRYDIYYSSKRITGLQLASALARIA
jgi:hypothetical protein